MSASAPKLSVGVCVVMQDKISAEDKAELETRIQKVRATLTEQDTDAIRAEVKSLQELSWKVSQQAYSQVRGVLAKFKVTNRH